MKRTMGLIACAMLGATLVSGAPSATAQAQATKAGAACGAKSDPAVPNNATEPKSGRQFILQYPCDLKKDEKVVLILNIHGAGSSSSYQHRYFPAGDYAEKYRLVVATPTAAAAMPGRVWRAEADDQFLHDLTDLMFSEFGKQNIKSFWLAGHSQGGATSARIVCSDFFKTRVDGFFSLSGGRQGGRTERNPQYNAPAPGAPIPETVANQGPGAARPAGATPGAAPATPPTPAADGPSTCDYSHISTYGEWEVAAMPDKSTIADKFGCKSRVARPDIVDEKAGYVWDPSRQNPTRIGWGRQQRPGSAKMWVYEGCNDQRVVADVLRLDKGHTEGLEPKVTEEIVKLMVSAKGGRAQKY
jgi:pimeloyl-ACP methyl ester carboxylesterase